MDLQIVPASADDAVVLQNLFQLYTHDFSEHWAGTDKGDLDLDGRFAHYPLEPYWHSATWRASLFRVAGALAGFALVNPATHSGLAADHSVAEFFVVRKYRGQGVGRLAAQRLFTGATGQWEVAVARKNVRALAFWRAAIASCPRVGDVTEMDARGPAWDGAIVRFRIE